MASAATMASSTLHRLLLDFSIACHAFQNLHADCKVGMSLVLCLAVGPSTVKRQQYVVATAIALEAMARCGNFSLI
jgi:hypothetical protein